MTGRPDFLILGQGLLGSLLALDLSASGATVLIADFSPRRCSSLVSAGMMDPISGQRFTPSWRYAETAPYAISVYERLSKMIGDTLLTPRPIYRLFRDLKDREMFFKKNASGALHPYVTDVFETPPHPYLATPYGGITIDGGIHVEVGRLVHGLRLHFLNSNQLIINPSPSFTESLSVKATIHCTGGYAHNSPYFSWIPFRNSRGETILFDAPDLNLDAIVNNGNWIAPLKTGGYRAGATYEWNDLFTPPTKVGYTTLETHINTLIPTAKIQIIRTESGTRSNLCDSRPVVGPHPRYPTQWIASGLGSKGTQMAPFLSANLSKSLINDSSVDPEISINRFLKKIPHMTSN